MMYETADMDKDTRSLREMVEEMRKQPEDVASIENDWATGTRTYVYKSGRRVTSHLFKAQTSARPSTSCNKKSRATSEVTASLKKTMREADQNISDFIKRIAQLDVEISRLSMRGQYAGSLKYMRDDLLQRINKLKTIKNKCAAQLKGA